MSAFDRPRRDRSPVRGGAREGSRERSPRRQRAEYWAAMEPAKVVPAPTAFRGPKTVPIVIHQWNRLPGGPAPSSFAIMGRGGDCRPPLTPLTAQETKVQRPSAPVPGMALVAAPTAVAAPAPVAPLAGGQGGRQPPSFEVVHKPLTDMLNKLRVKSKLVESRCCGEAIDESAWSGLGGWADFVKSALEFQSIIMSTKAIGSSKLIGLKTRCLMTDVAQEIIAATDFDEKQTVILSTKGGSHIKCGMSRFSEMWLFRQQYWIMYYELDDVIRQVDSLASERGAAGQGPRPQVVSPTLIVRRSATPVATAASTFDSIVMDPNAATDEADYLSKHKTQVPRLWPDKESAVFFDGIYKPFAEISRIVMARGS